MKNQKIENQKIENQKIEKLDSLNLESFFLNEGERKGERKGDKKGSYQYKYENIIPEGENWKNWINGIEGKKFRNRMRGKLQGFGNSLFNSRLEKNPAKMESIAIEFIKFYEFHYSINDYGFESIASQRGKLSESEKRDLLDLLQIAKMIKGKN